MNAVAQNVDWTKGRPMGGKLISLIFKPSTELPELEELTSFLATDFARYQAGWKTLAKDVAWGDQSLTLLGTDGDGGLVALFPSVARRERELHDILGDAMIASTWHEDNRADLTERYGTRGIDVERRLRTILLTPSVVPLSRALARALDRASVEVMRYSIFEIDTSDGVLRAVSFDGGGVAPTVAASRSAAPASQPAQPSPAVAPSRDGVGGTTPAPAAAAPTSSVVAPAPSTAEPTSPKTEAPPSAPPPRPTPREPSPVETFISSLSDSNLKAMSEQVLTFLLARFPNASGIVNSPNSFTLNVGPGHLATIRMDKSSVWLEVGPERIPTNKIKDSMTLERAMNLPSVLDAISSVSVA
jgi:hypothetical protein